MGFNKDDITSSRTYQVALTSAVLLFLATLTAAILTILIARAREENRQVEFDLTLTAVHANVRRTEVSTVGTATPAPVITAGHYPFVMHDGDPVFSPAETCEYQLVTGNVLNLDRNPIDDYQIKVWGDYSPLVFLRIGEVSPGWWGVRLDGMVNRRIWVQLVHENRYLSAPIEVILSGSDCDQNRVEIDFVQIERLG